MRLAAPLRVVWDWNWSPAVCAGPARPSPAARRSVGQKLVDAQVLMLEVGYPGHSSIVEGELSDALRGFTGLLSIVVTPSVAERLGGGERVEGLQPAELWVDVTPPSDGSSAGALPRTAFARRLSVYNDFRGSGTGIVKNRLPTLSPYSGSTGRNSSERRP